MLSKRFEEFLHDERGSYTLWSLMWFMLYVAIGGLAVDGTDAYRNQTLLQATADAAALAGVMSLYETGEDPVDSAIAYADINLEQNQHGTVLDPTDVYLGIWDFDAKRFDVAAYDPTEEDGDVNAVYVITRKAEGNGNPLFMNFLRILQLWGLEAFWNINTEAIAVRYIPQCLTNNGLVAWNKVDVTSNNNFNNICVHAQNAIEDPGHNYSIDINNNNVIGPGTQFSQPDPSDFNDRPNVCTQNDGLCEEGVIVQGSLPTLDALGVNSTLGEFMNYENLPAYLFTTNELGNTVLVNEPVTVNENYAGPYAPQTVYQVNCSSESNQLALPTEVLIYQVAIIANCRITGESGVQLTSALIASTSDGNGPNGIYQNAIHFPSGLQVGDSRFCEPDSNGLGQVHIYSASSIHVAAGPDVYGLRMVARGDIQFTANNDVYGISAQAGNNITATANGNWEYCEGEFTGPFAYHYRLVW